MAADRPLCDRMSGRRPFSELTKEFSPERRRRIDETKRKLLAEMPLHELRRARALTQQELAQKLQVNQPATPNWSSGQTCTSPVSVLT